MCTVQTGNCEPCRACKAGMKVLTFLTSYNVFCFCFFNLGLPFGKFLRACVLSDLIAVPCVCRDVCGPSYIWSRPVCWVFKWTFNSLKCCWLCMGHRGEGCCKQVNHMLCQGREPTVTHALVVSKVEVVTFDQKTVMLSMTTVECMIPLFPTQSLKSKSAFHWSPFLYLKSKRVVRLVFVSGGRRGGIKLKLFVSHCMRHKLLQTFCDGPSGMGIRKMKEIRGSPCSIFQKRVRMAIFWQLFVLLQVFLFFCFCFKVAFWLEKEIGE